jgi:hypothetical protein
MTTTFKPVRRRRGFTHVYTLEVVVDGMFADNFGTYKTLEEAAAEGARMEAEHRLPSSKDSIGDDF